MIAGLYVPGDRPDRFAKALGSGADLVVIDLQDAVAPDRRSVARDAVREALAAPRDGTPRIEVRVAEPEDLVLVGSLPAMIGIRLPDVGSPAEVDAAVGIAPGRTVTALVEDARGLVALQAIAGHPAVTAIALGESDLAGDLRSTSPAVLEHARIRAVIAARAAGLPAPAMSVWPDLPDLDGLRADCARGRALGMRGRMAVHPAQLPVIREAFAATPEELDWAREVVAVVGDGGVARLASGAMVDPAMLARARELLES